MLQACLDNYTFLPFSGFLAIFWIFTYKKVPETKNKTFEEILALFRHGHDRYDGKVAMVSQPQPTSDKVSRPKSAQQKGQ